MVTVHLMTDHRRFTGGEGVIEVDGRTVGEVIDNLEVRYPGLGELLRNGSSAGMHGEIHSEPDYVAVQPGTVIYFVAPLAGG